MSGAIFAAAVTVILSWALMASLCVALITFSVRWHRGSTPCRQIKDEWTDALPTIWGWYWYSGTEDFSIGKPVLVEVNLTEMNIYSLSKYPPLRGWVHAQVCCSGRIYCADIRKESWSGKWLGPIEPPK